MRSIANTHDLIVTLRHHFPRRRLAKIIGVSTVSIQRWEEEQVKAQARYAPGFDKAVERMCRHFKLFPEVQQLMAEQLQVRTSTNARR